MFNHANLDPQLNGATYTWELHDLPWVEREDYSPAPRSPTWRLADSSLDSTRRQMPLFIRPFFR
jgi:hypothetical protein